MSNVQGGFIQVEKRTIHHAWDNSLEPVERVSSGDELTVQCLDAGGGQLSPESTDQSLLELDFNRVNPVTGPIYVEGAEVGDVLEVEIREMKVGDWGWTGIIPGFGLLHEEFPDPFLRIWELSGEKDSIRFANGIDIPCAPFPGTIGVALDEEGTHSIIPPRKNGGNMDNRGLTRQTKLYFPVWVEGALFSVGDPHAAQGDGEVCGTAIEVPMDITLSFDVHKNYYIEQPQFQTPGPLATQVNTSSYYATMGIDEDLMEAAKKATRFMIEHLERRRGLTRADAYMLCSLAGELKISQIVDQPNWTVSMYMPDSIFKL